MKISFKTGLIAFLGALLFLMPITTGLVNTVHLSAPVAAVAAYAVYTLASRLTAHTLLQGSVYGNAIQKEIWVNYIIDRLWKDNTFLKYAWNDDDKVLAGKVVHIPNPGARPTTAINRDVFPATAVRRTDTDIVYTLDEYTTDPTHIEDAEKVEVSYDKISSVIGDHIGYLTEDVADNMLLRWLDETVTTPQKVYTSGAEAPASADEMDGAPTGNRKQLLANDVRKCQLSMNLQKVPKKNRFALLESNMLDQLLGDLSQTQYRDFSKSMDEQNGVVGKLYGFTIFDRSSTAIYDNTNALKAFGAAGAATDNLSSFFWQQDCVTRALGEVKIFSNVDRPEYYGDIYSALLRMGGRRRRQDDAGVIAMIQSA
jgi:hypothetical protein